MTFQEFAALHGVTVNRLTLGKWMRVPTKDKPKSTNGAYKFLGDAGFVQNWATMTEPAMWKAEGDNKAGQQRVQRIADAGAQEAAAQARKAAQKAAAMLSECELAPHPYLASKGFPDELANVWNREAQNILVIPMKSGRNITGCQMIAPDGDKKFLFGQRSGGAEFVFDAKGLHVLCEGYATALSARQAMQNLKVGYTLHVTFSAGNMKKIAANLPPGLVLADNDESGTGERVAKEIGWPYWMSDTVGEDANDFSQRRGVFALAMGLKEFLMKRRRA